MNIGAQLRQYEKIIQFLAARFARYGLEREDAIQEARIGAWRALTKWESAKGSSESAYVWGGVLQHLRTWSRTSRRHGFKRSGSIKVGPCEIPASLDAPVDDEPEVKTLHDLLGHEPEQEEALMCREAASALSSEQRSMFLMRIEGMTLEEIGAARGFSRERVRQILLKSVEQVEQVADQGNGRAA